MTRLPLTIVLVLLTACGAPAATAFAPEDLAFGLPREIRGTPLTIETRAIDEILETGGGEQYRRLLLDVGREPADFLIASATSDDSSFGTTFTPPSIAVYAYRIRGVAAQRLVENFLAQAVSSPGTAPVPLTVSGRSVLALRNSAPDSVGYAYLKGEVLYLVSTYDAAAPAEAVADADAAIAALP